MFLKSKELFIKKQIYATIKLLKIQKKNKYVKKISKKYFSVF
jgi:hypothetical protein